MMERGHDRGGFRDPHLEHRRAQEHAHRAAVGDDADPLSSLVTVELNVTELCNRACAFCPRVDPEVYPNRNLHMDVALADHVAADLAGEGSRCRISFSGFGEPLLHPRFPELVAVVRRRLPANTIEINTNGDRLTAGGIRELFEAGLTYLYVNLYDGPEQRPVFEAMMPEAGVAGGRWRLRPHWPEVAPDFGLTDFGLTLNNRSGTVRSPGLDLQPLQAPLVRRCFYPFYKMLIDWNGDVLFCSNDWGRVIVVGNARERTIRELWLSPAMFAIRRRLMDADRSESPCNRCDVQGTLHGRWSYTRLVEAYAADGRLSAVEASQALAPGPGDPPGDPATEGESTATP